MRERAREKRRKEEREEKRREDKRREEKRREEKRREEKSREEREEKRRETHFLLLYSFWLCLPTSVLSLTSCVWRHTRYFFVLHLKEDSPLTTCEKKKRRKKIFFPSCLVQITFEEED